MPIEKLLDEFRNRRPLRAGSLILTVYIDAIAPHGGTVWLGSLIKLLEPFGLNARLVRTSVYRLSQDNWLTAKHVGRRSYYSLTQSGRRRFDEGYRRIYALPQQEWDGQWCLIFTGVPQITTEQRETIRRELLWQGFGSLAPGVLAHPSRDIDGVMPALKELEVHDKVAIMLARGADELSMQPMTSLVQSCWDLSELSDNYKQLLDRFRPIWTEMQNEDELDPQRCFFARTLLIHEYRRILKRDPQLPDELLPAGWPGTAARLLCRNLYKLTQEPAEKHLMAMLETAEGPVPEAASYYYNRFGGL